MLKAHRSVLLAFVGPRPVGLDILHRDSDETNAHLWNLEYGTRKQNVADTIAMGRHNQFNTYCKRGHEFTPENTKINKAGARVCQACAKLYAEARRVG